MDVRKLLFDFFKKANICNAGNFLKNYFPSNNFTTSFTKNNSCSKQTQCCTLPCSIHEKTSMQGFLLFLAQRQLKLIGYCDKNWIKSLTT